jgi:hypothetical protein
MVIEDVKAIIMNQAKEKGFGTTPKDVVVAEKIALIHSEISEVYDAYIHNCFRGHHGFYEEMGDVFQRAVHLAGVFGVDFPPNLRANTKKLPRMRIEEIIAKLHRATSAAWESYRFKKMEEFKSELINLILYLEKIAEKYNFSLEEAVIQKIERNKTKDWDKQALNEKLM